MSPAARAQPDTQRNDLLRLCLAAGLVLVALCPACSASHPEQRPPEAPEGQSAPASAGGTEGSADTMQYEAPSSVDEAPSSMDDSVPAGGSVKKSTARAEEERPPAPAPAREPADSPTILSPAESESDFGGFFEGDTYDGPTDRDEVEELANAIRESAASQRSAVADYEATGPRTCNEVCDLSEAICASSTKICKIAGNHPTESYFEDRCRWSRKECRTADEQCSTCSR